MLRTTSPETVELYDEEVNTTASRAPEDSTAHASVAQLALPAGRAATIVRLRAVALAFLAWTTLLFAAFGGATGAVSQTLAGNPAANALHLQRHAGPSSATRAARRDNAQSFAKVQPADKLHVATSDGGSGALPAVEPVLQAGNAEAETLSIAAAEPRLKPRYSAHPSRAPPALA